MDQFMRLVMTVLLLITTGVSFFRHLARRRDSFSGTNPDRVVLGAHVLAASWLSIGLVAQLQGGTALWGNVEGARLYLRHNPGSAKIDVSPLHWILSLISELLVIGMGPLALAVYARRCQQPTFAGWIGSRVFTWFSVGWSVAIGLMALPRLVLWARTMAVGLR